MDDRFDDLLNDLADRYRDLRPIGAGGMAVVFRGEDRGTGRDVAIKVLDPMVASRIATERFVREVELCGGIDHASCVAILAVGEAAGLPYFVMPYVGESLRHLLDRAGSLRLEVAVPIARDVADVLVVAHATEVVHRDIKPANILLDDGRAVVADFGIAKAICDACGPDLTMPGLQIGTPAYMSPEQAFGSDTPDPRTDVFSLGAVLHEMLLGSPPDVGDPELAKQMRLLGRPRANRRRQPGHRIAKLLSEMLAWLPDQRPTAAQVRAAMDGLLDPPAERAGWRHVVGRLRGWWSAPPAR